MSVLIGIRTIKKFNKKVKRSMLQTTTILSASCYQSKIPPGVGQFLRYMHLHLENNKDHKNVNFIQILFPCSSPSSSPSSSFRSSS